VFFSLIPGLRAARRIGAAERREKRGDLRGTLTACSEALEILGRPGVDLEMGWCRAGVSVALWGYARSAQELGLQRELWEALVRWRPVYLRWMESPVTPDEAKYLKWFEEMLEYFRKSS
jgi:hypothetical protein